MSVFEPVMQAVSTGMREPTPDEIDRALAEMQDLAERGQFYLSQNQSLLDMQIKCYAFGYQAKDMPIVRQPEKTPEELQRIRIRQQRDASQKLAGYGSIYADVAWETSRPEEPINWMANVFAKSGKRVALLLGNVGTGKTHAAIAYAGWMMAETRNSGMFITAYDLLTALSYRQQDKLEAIERTKYLIIDDIGTHNTDFKGNDFRSYFENLFNKRHQMNRTTIITGNITVKDFKDIFGERVASRGAEIGAAIEFNGPDLRRKDGV